jgi:hypothetical protein
MYPVLFRVGAFEVTSFGVLVALGALVGIWLFGRELARSGLPADASNAAVAGGSAGSGAGSWWTVEFAGQSANWQSAVQPRRVELVRRSSRVSARGCGCCTGIACRSYADSRRPRRPWLSATRLGVSAAFRRAMTTAGPQTCRGAWRSRWTCPNRRSSASDAAYEALARAVACADSAGGARCPGSPVSAATWSLRVRSGLRSNPQVNLRLLGPLTLAHLISLSPPSARGCLCGTGPELALRRGGRHRVRNRTGTALRFWNPERSADRVNCR